MPRVFLICLFILLFAFPVKAEDIGYDDSKAVVFLYHRVGEDNYPESNLRLEQLKQHIKELQTGDYNVLPVPEIVTALKKGEPLPDKTVGITFESAYTSTYKKALPALLKADLPFTLFVAPDRIDRQSDQYMSWDELRKLAKKKEVTIGALPASYIHMLDLEKKDLKAQLNRSIARFREELDEVPELFAYPHGERNKRVQDILKDYDFAAAFGQQSGVAYHGLDIYDLPRFSMTESYGDLDRFQMTASALPLPVTELTPDDPELSDNQPAIGFTVNGNIDNLKTLACFASGHGRVDLERLDNRVELRLDEPFEDERARINCTMPVNGKEPGEPQRWRWYGMLFSVPEL